MSGRTRTISLAAAFATLSAAWTATAQTAIPPSAPDFATAAAQSDAYEILAADTALAQSQNSQVRAFAEEMIRDHTRTSESLSRAVVKSGLTPPPPAVDADQGSLLAALQSLRGPDFDKANPRPHSGPGG
jgi:putative membrane protein